MPAAPVKLRQENSAHFTEVRQLTFGGVRYRLGHQLAQSFLSTVFKAEDEWNSPLVVKRHHADVPAWMWQNEVANLRRFRHPLITFMYAAFEHEGVRYVVLERCGLAANRLRLEDAGQRQRVCGVVARDLLQALHFIHRAGFRHGDVNPGNILLNQSGEGAVRGIKLCDLALTELAGGGAMPRGGCRWNPPPESFESADRGGLGQPTDIYQASMVLLNFMLGEVPQFGQEEILSGKPQTLAKELGTPLGEALAQGLATDPGLRPTAIGLWRAISKGCAGAMASASGADVSTPSWF